MATITWVLTPTIKEVTLPSGNTYYLKDADVRDWIGTGSTSGAEYRISELEDEVAKLSNATHWLGITTTSLSDGSTTNPITINGQSVTAVSGDIVQDSNSNEFIFNGTAWQQFGASIGTLKAFAFVDTGTVTIQPKGTNSSSSVSFSGGTSDNVLGENTTFTNASSAVTFSGGTSATVLTSDVTATVPKTSSTKKYMTASASGTAVSTTDDTIKPVTSVGTPASWSATVSNENLTFSWTADTVPTLGSDKTFLTGASVSAQPTVTLSAATTTSTGAIDYVSDVSTSGTDNVTFDTTTSGATASAITSLGTGTAAAQTITVGTNDTVTAVTDIGTGTAAAQTFTGTSESYTVNPDT